SQTMPGLNCSSRCWNVSLTGVSRITHSPGSIGQFNTKCHSCLHEARCAPHAPVPGGRPRQRYFTKEKGLFKPADCSWCNRIESHQSSMPCFMAQDKNNITDNIGDTHDSSSVRIPRAAESARRHQPADPIR